MRSDDYDLGRDIELTLSIMKRLNWQPFLLMIALLGVWATILG